MLGTGTDRPLGHQCNASRRNTNAQVRAYLRIFFD